MTLEGRQIGRVAKAGLDIDADTGNITTPVEIGIDALALDPQAGTVNTRDELGEKLNQALAKLVQNGLRAKVVSSGFLSTGKSVELAMAPGAKPAQPRPDPPAARDPRGTAGVPEPPPPTPAGPRQGPARVAAVRPGSAKGPGNRLAPRRLRTRHDEIPRPAVIAETARPKWNRSRFDRPRTAPY